MKKSKALALSLTSCGLIALCAASPQLAVAQQSASAAQTPSLSTVSASGPVAAHKDRRYRIGPGDVLDIRVFNRPQLSRDAVRVDNQGMIRMPLIEDDIRAACLTEGELAKEIATRYLKYQRHPNVDVFVKEYNSQTVAVIGAVNKPGRFQMQRQIHLFELLTYVEGPSDHAGRTIQVVHTPGTLSCDAPPAAQTAETDEDAGLELVTYKLSDTLQADEKANPIIRPGDIVRIPDADQAYVVGNVKNSGPIPLRDPVTVTRAIAMAGGVLQDSKLDKIVIVRQTPGSAVKTEIPVNLKAINKHQATDIALLPGDIVNVPESTGRSVLRNLLGSVGPAAATLPVRVIP